MESTPVLRFPFTSFSVLTIGAQGGVFSTAGTATTRKAGKGGGLGQFVLFVFVLGRGESQRDKRGCGCTKGAIIGIEHLLQSVEVLQEALRRAQQRGREERERAVGEEGDPVADGGGRRVCVKDKETQKTIRQTNAKDIVDSVEKVDNHLTLLVGMMQEEVAVEAVREA